MHSVLWSEPAASQQAALRNARTLDRPDVSRGLSSRLAVHSSQSFLSRSAPSTRSARISRTAIERLKPPIVRPFERLCPAGSTRGQRADIQNLVIKSWPRFDPTAAPVYYFAKTTTRHRVNSLIRAGGIAVTRQFVSKVYDITGNPGEERIGYTENCRRVLNRPPAGSLLPRVSIFDHSGHRDPRD